MARIVLKALCAFLFVFSFYSVAENAFTKINHYKVLDSYVSQYATVSDDEKYLFDVSLHNEGQTTASAAFKVFTKVDEQGYQQSQILELPDELSQSFKKISHLIFHENYLLAVVDENYRRKSHRFLVDDQGKLTYMDETIIDWMKYDHISKVVSLNGGNFYEYSSKGVSFWNIAEDGLLTHKFDFMYHDQTGYEDFMHDFIPVVNGARLVLVRMNKDLEQESHKFQINQYDINWDTNSFSEVLTETISINDDYTHANEKLFGAMVNTAASSIYLRTSHSEFIFKGLGSAEISLAYRNDKSGYSFAIDQKSQKLFENDDVFKEVLIDWQTSKVERIEFSDIKLYGNVRFLTPTLLLKMPSFARNEGELWHVSANKNINQVNIFVDNVGDLPLDLQRKYFYDEQSHQLLVTGDANTSPEENDFKLYVWGYNLAQNDFSYSGSASCCSNESLNNSLIRYPLGVYGENYYALAREGLFNHKIARMERINSGIQLAQEFPLNEDEAQLTLVNDVFFADENTIVAELYGNHIQGLLMKICKLDNSGQIDNCTQDTLFVEYEFEGDLTDYKFYKLSTSGQFLFAPINHQTTTTHLFFVEFDGNTFEIKQQFPLNKSGDVPNPVSLITLANNNQDLFVKNGTVLHFELKNNEWQLTENAQTSTLGDITGEDNYYLTRTGIASVYDSKSKRFWWINQQARNLSGWFQLTGDNKGFAIDVSDRYRTITTFELTNSKPSIYTGGIKNGTEYYAAQDELLEIDFSQFFLNPEGGVKIKAPEKFTFENGIFSGILLNDDIVFGEYPDGRKIKVSIVNGVDYIGYFYLIPKNVNDAPELKVVISREYLKANEAYEVNLNEYVNDPDRDSMIFKATGLPNGYSLAGSHIRGASTDEGNYTINVTADDQNGGKFTFQIPITINSTGEQESTDTSTSGSGGGSYGGLILLMIIAFVRRLTLLRI